MLGEKLKLLLLLQWPHFCCVFLLCFVHLTICRVGQSYFDILVQPVRLVHWCCAYLNSHTSLTPKISILVKSVIRTTDYAGFSSADFVDSPDLVTAVSGTLGCYSGWRTHLHTTSSSTKLKESLFLDAIASLGVGLSMHSDKGCGTIFFSHY